MKYVADRTLRVRDPYTGQMHQVTEGEVVSEARMKRFRREYFSPLKRKARKVTEKGYTLAEAKLLAELYLEHNGCYTSVVDNFLLSTNSPDVRRGSVQCMVRRMMGLDSHLEQDNGLPEESHKDFPKVYKALIEIAPNPSRFL